MTVPDTNNRLLEQTEYESQIRVVLDISSEPNTQYEIKILNDPDPRSQRIQRINLYHNPNPVLSQGITIPHLYESDFWANFMTNKSPFEVSHILEALLPIVVVNNIPHEILSPNYKNMYVAFLTTAPNFRKKFKVSLYDITDNPDFNTNHRLPIRPTKTIQFGDASYEDYTTHLDTKRKIDYIKRHRKNEDWTINGIETAGFWSRWLLWNQPTLRASMNDIEARFPITIIRDIADLPR